MTDPKNQPASEDSVRRSHVLLLYGLLSVVAFFLFVGVPIPCLVDSSSYFQHSHYLRTGQYVWQSWFSNFTGPNQISFTLGGYSIWIFLSQALEDGTSIPWFLWLKAIQFAWYLHSAFLVYLIACRLRRPLAGVAGMILFFIYYPFIHTASIMMSEIAGIWLGLLVLWLYLKGMEENNKVIVGISFFLAGYSVLVRTIFAVLLPLLFSFSLLVNRRGTPRKQWSVKTWILLAGLLAACPAAQSVWNKKVYGNYRLTVGVSIHLYNRVIHQDQSIPKDCSASDMEALRHTIYRRGDQQWYGSWYDLFAYLNDQGYTQDRAEAVASRIAWAGLKENKMKYLVNTFVTSANEMVQYAPPEKLFHSIDQVFTDIGSFGEHDPQEAMLSSALLPQEPFYRNRLAQISMSANHAFAEIYEILFSTLRLQYVIASGYFVWVAFLIYSRNSLGLVVALAGLMTVVATCMITQQWVRYRLPAQPIFLLGLVLAISEMVTLFKKDTKSLQRCPPS